MKMTLARALKEKSRLVGEINRIKDIIQKNNRIIVNSAVDDKGNPVISDEEINAKRKLDLNAAMADYNIAYENMIKIKIAITKANSGAADTLVRLAEAKSYLTNLNGFACGEDTDSSGYNSNQVTLHRFAFNNIWLMNRQKELTNLINSLQDKIDEYNATTTIDVEFM